MRSSRRILDLPRDQRPCWYASDNRSDPWYLGWGLRNFHKSPTMSRLSDRSRERGGRGMMLILRGSPTILLGEGPLRLQPGQAILTAPPCDYTAGFLDESDEYCEILAWIWRTPPLWTEVRPRQRDHYLCRVNEQSRQRLRAAHGVCRQEVEQWDKFSAQFLRGVRVQLETVLARSVGADPSAGSHQQITGAASRWLDQDFHQPNAILLLCDYLQVSRSTLDRVFAVRFGRPRPSSVSSVGCVRLRSGCGRASGRSSTSPSRSATNIRTTSAGHSRLTKDGARGNLDRAFYSIATRYRYRSALSQRSMPAPRSP